MQVFFNQPAMYEAHDALLCIAEIRYLSQILPPSGDTPSLFQVRQEMKELFADLPEAISKTPLSLPSGVILCQHRAIRFCHPIRLKRVVPKKRRCASRVKKDWTFALERQI